MPAQLTIRPFHETDAPQVEDLWKRVFPDRRREEIGAAVVLDLEQRLSALGCPKLNLQVRSFNREVIDCDISLGYQIEERVSMGKPLVPR